MSYNWINKDVLSEYRLIVNCTPVGMYPNEDDCPQLPYELLNENNVCYDCIYNPEETLFLKKAKDRGALTIGGKQMFINQAKESWKIWME